MTLTWGNTPLVELKKYQYKNVRVFAKLEGVSLGGSIKDRIGFWMIYNAVKNGYLTKDKTIIEATSGNTGIGLAIAACQYDIKCKLLVPKSTSKEKITCMKALGATVEVVDGTIDDCIELVQVMSNKSDYVWLNQYDNTWSIDCHYSTTAPEIYASLNDYYEFCDWNSISLQEHQNVFVAAMGTTGTVMGCGEYLKPLGWRIFGVVPDKNCKIEGLKNMQTQRKPRIYNPEYVELLINVTDTEAIQAMRNLAKSEGIMAGLSSGAAMAAAVYLAKKLQDDKKPTNIVVILPDRGSNYLNSGVWD